MKNKLILPPSIFLKNKFVCYYYFLDNKQKESIEAMAELENIDGQADKVGIAMVKINDLELVAEFGLGKLPQLVYYRHTTPIVYDGMLISLINIICI